MDTVISYWVEVVAPTEYITEGLGLSIQDLETYFYAENGIIASIHMERLQRTFGILAGFFYRVGLQMNVRNTVSMECQSCHEPGHISSEEYKQMKKGTGPTFQERQRRGVAFP